uniref:Uncharacterized protein n=1 Tax=Amphimedon queenslandica TaxID=400682 RepID=A0A1X7V3F2_AMPQE
KFISVSVRYLVRDQSDESFRVNFLQSLTATCLDISLKKKAIIHFNTSNVMQEGTEFLTYLIHLIIEHEWHQKNYEKILEDWLMIVFNLIDLSDVEDRNELIKFITTNEKKLWNDLESLFYRQLEDLLSKWCHNLPVEDLISIINVVESEQFNKPKVLMMLSTEPRNPMSKGILTALSQKLFGESDDAYQSKFKVDDRVVMESRQGQLVTGTVRWVGLVRALKIESKSSAIGIETDNIIDPLNDFPGLSLNVTGKLFKVSPGHSCIYLPEGVVKYIYEEVEEEISNEELNHEWESSHQ